MKYIKYFESASTADGYVINDIPFVTTIATNPAQNLVCNEEGKKLVNVGGGIIEIQSGVPEGFVDLGLPSGTFWANFNIGSTNGNTKESWYGNYYAWGEIEPKEDYWYKNYKFYNNEYKVIKYCDSYNQWNAWGGEGLPDNKLVLEPEDDAATCINSLWSIPTREQIVELCDKTLKTWETNYNDITGLNGVKFTKIIETPAYKNIPLYTIIETDGSIVDPYEINDWMWEYLSDYTLEELIDRFGGNDFRPYIFKDATCQIVAEYGVDYELVIKTPDYNTFVFMPTNGFIHTSEYLEEGKKTIIENEGKNVCIRSSSIREHPLNQTDDAHYSPGLNARLDNNKIRIYTSNVEDLRPYGSAIRPVINQQHAS